MDPIVALMLSGAIEEERRRSSGVRRRWLDSRADRVAEETLDRRQTVRDRMRPVPSSPVG
jgi:hypothetical protein